MTDRILCAPPDIARDIIRAYMYERGIAIIRDEYIDIIIAEIRECGNAPEALRVHILSR